jgi:glycosyltransferase involved in cell wall biosynthesis
VHREICGNAAVYFPRFSPQLLADSIVQVEESLALRRRLAECGLKRSHEFSWHDHVDQIISLAHSLKHSSRGYLCAA